MIVQFVEDDTGSLLRVYAVDSSGVALNLTDYNPFLIWENVVSGVSYTKAMTVVSAPGGELSYVFDTGELMVGDNRAEVKLVHKSTSVVLRSRDSFIIRAREKVEA